MRRSRLVRNVLAAPLPLLALAAAAAPAAAATVTITVFLRVDAAGKCTTVTPGVAEAAPGDTLEWRVVHVRSGGNGCPAATRLQVEFPRLAVGHVAAPAAQPAAEQVEEAAFTTRREALDRRLAPADREKLRRFATRAEPAPGGEMTIGAAFASRLTAKAIGAPGLYKYNVRIVGGAIEDPPIKIMSPP